jgi:hypothetical protein
MINYNVDILGVFNTSSFADVHKDIFQEMAEKDFEMIFESGGMDGTKYRNMMMGTIFTAIEKKTGSNYQSMSDAVKSHMNMSVATVLGMLLGTTGSRATIMKNCGDFVNSRVDDNNPLGFACSILYKNFCTYVADKTDDLVPSLKYASCMPDFTLLGVCMLYAVVKKEEGLEEMEKDEVKFKDFPDIFQKQWIGNFDLDMHIQEEHRQWEVGYWMDKIDKTNNPNNKNFTKEFHQEFYENTISDKYHLFTHTYAIVRPTDREGYTMKDIADYICVMVRFYIKEWKARDASKKGESDFAKRSEKPLVEKKADLKIREYIEEMRAIVNKKDDTVTEEAED